jgi:phage terminase small subunit
MADHAIPRHVSRASRSWLEHLLADFTWTPSEWRLAILAAETFDRAATARRSLSREGLTITSPRGEVKPHPCVPIVRDATALAARLVAQLGLDVQEDDEDESPVLVDSLGRRRRKS